MQKKIHIIALKLGSIDLYIAMNLCLHGTLSLSVCTMLVWCTLHVLLHVCHFYSDVSNIFLKFQCPPCRGSTSCGKDNMICLEGVRMCVCDSGYRLDMTGMECEPLDQIISPQTCDEVGECSLIPNTRCHESLGNFIIIDGFLFLTLKQF